MAKKKMSFAERMMRLAETGFRQDDHLRQDPRLYHELVEKERTERLNTLIELLNKNRSMKAGHTLTFIMYDIENNRIRRYIARYLEKMGYQRVQKSVFFGNVPKSIHQEVCETLKSVNAKYKNGDSLMCLPISLDMFHNLRVIGKDLDYELVVEQKNTLFF